MIMLEKRPLPSRGWTFATPILAVVLTMLVGGALFAALGKDPLVTIRTIFYDPLFSEFSWYYRYFEETTPSSINFFSLAVVVAGCRIRACTHNGGFGNIPTAISPGVAQ